MEMYIPICDGLVRITYKLSCIRAVSISRASEESFQRIYDCTTMQTSSQHSKLHSTVVQVEYEDVFRTDLHQLVHDVRHLTLLNHTADSDPLLVL